MFEIPKDASPQTHLAFVEATAALGKHAFHPLLGELVETGGTSNTHALTTDIEQSLQDRYGFNWYEASNIAFAAAWRLTESTKLLRQATEEDREKLYE